MSAGLHVPPGPSEARGLEAESPLIMYKVR